MFTISLSPANESLMIKDKIVSLYHRFIKWAKKVIHEIKEKYLVRLEIMLHKKVIVTNDAERMLHDIIDCSKKFITAAKKDQDNINAFLSYIKTLSSADGPSQNTGKIYEFAAERKSLMTPTSQSHQYFLGKYSSKIDQITIIPEDKNGYDARVLAVSDIKAAIQCTQDMGKLLDSMVASAEKSLSVWNSIDQASIGSAQKSIDDFISSSGMLISDVSKHIPKFLGFMMRLYA